VTAATTSRRGFTLLEVLLAMTIFSMLGLVVVFLMRQGMSVFATGTADSQVLDRMDTVLPKVRRDLVRLYTGDRFDPPAPPPDAERLQETRKEVPPPPPVDVRLRSGTITLRDAPPGLRDVRCTYFAFVTATTEEWRDALLRRDVTPGATPKEYVPSEVNQAGGTDAAFLPPGGLMEVCWLAVPEDPAQPGVLTLRRGYRAPIGGADSLLDPANVDSLPEIEKRCPVVERGVLHFSVLWRNAFATSWDTGVGSGAADTDPLVDSTWDSTRGLDKTFRLFRGPESLADPSDDRFPSAVRVEIVLASASQRGYAPETRLSDVVDDTSGKIVVLDTGPLFALRGAIEGEDRFLKVDAEWMRYRVTSDNPSPQTGGVELKRGQRLTKAVPHEPMAPVYVGTTYRQELRLRMMRDAYARKAR
jgi:prepilin-type N-terminal cleavage/methylation domain-containing protein